MSTVREYYACPVCSKRWGEFDLGSEMKIERCEEHKNDRSTAEIYAMGFSVGTYYRRDCAR